VTHRCFTLALVLAITWTAPAHAGKKAGQAHSLDPGRVEFGILPVVNYDSDVGVGVGVLSALARHDPAFDPYRWRLVIRFVISFDLDPDRKIEVPLLQTHLIGDFPGLLDGRLRLGFRGAFFRASNNGFYGFGNASRKQEGRHHGYYQYMRTCPVLDLWSRWSLLDWLELFAGTSFVYNHTHVYENSFLAEVVDEKRGRLGSDLLFGTDPHPGWSFQGGLLVDTRNHEFSPSRGMFHDASLRLSPGLVGQPNHGGANLTLRFFFSPTRWLRNEKWREFIVLAARLIGDVLIGDPPLYEMTRYGGLLADEGPGGKMGARGIPGQRYHGKIKVIGNFEIRLKLPPLPWWKRRMALGLVMFVDAGRVWADLSRNRELDGSGPGLEWCLGGGGRIHWEESFVVRADAGFCPAGETWALQVYLGHLF
jgi:hypothetical protein